MTFDALTLVIWSAVAVPMLVGLGLWGMTPLMVVSRRLKPKQAVRRLPKLSIQVKLNWNHAASNDDGAQQAA